MNMMLKAFSKKLFGARYERLAQSLVIALIVYGGLALADFKLLIAPFVLYLTVTSFTAGVMWQALSSKDQADALQNMMMLPFAEQKFVFSYTAALGSYTIFTKTAALFAVLLSVTVWSKAELIGSILCTINAVLMAAALFSWQKNRYAAILWCSALLTAGILLSDSLWFLPMLTANIALAVTLLRHADPYSFYRQEGSGSRKVKEHRHCFILLYFFRYLQTHKNYLTNTAIMWCAACFLPLFFRQLDTNILFAVPVAFAILSMNTPVCILLSCDPGLEQAVRFLPCQKKLFCVPYCFFIFLCSMIADAIFLCSLQIQIGGVTVLMIAAAVFFALLSAVLSVLMEWFYPIRGWKIESDLWHHPRKYIVPAVMLFIAALIH